MNADNSWEEGQSLNTSEVKSVASCAFLVSGLLRSLQKAVMAVMVAFAVLPTFAAEVPQASCGGLAGLLGEWDWQSEHPSSTSPQGTFSFSSDLKGNVIVGRVTRVYPGKGTPFGEVFVIHPDSVKGTNQSMYLYFDDLGHASHCILESSDSACTVNFTCRSEGVHLRYVFVLPARGPVRFQLQVPPPHRHGEFVPYLGGIMKKR